MSTRSFQQIVADAASRPATRVYVTLQLSEPAALALAVLLADVACDEAKRLGLPHPNEVHKSWYTAYPAPVRAAYRFPQIGR